MKNTPFDKNTLFQGQPKAIKYAVTYMENYRENEVMENGGIYYEDMSDEEYEKITGQSL